jgi:hypothetical protein
VLAHWYALEIAASTPLMAPAWMPPSARRLPRRPRACSPAWWRKIASPPQSLFATDSQAAFREAGVAFSRLAARELLATNG